MRLLGRVATQGHDTTMQGHDTAQGRAHARCDTTAWACDTARPGLHTAPLSASTRPPRTRPGRAGWALGAPNQFLTQYTVSESLFGTLFMNTVHKIFQKQNEIFF